MTVYGGPRPTPPAPKPDKLLLGAAGAAVLAVVAGIVFGAQAFMSGDPQASGAPAVQHQVSAPPSAPASPPPSAAPSLSPSATPSPTPTPKKAAILAEKPSLVLARHSGQCLQAGGGNGANAAQQPCDPNNPTMRWIPQAMVNSTDTFQLINAADSRCLSVRDNSKDNWAEVWLWDCHADIGQAWRMVADQDGYRFLNPNSNRCMSIESARQEPGALARIWDCNGAPDQRFVFQPL
ncbi:RICIN domain-containing protein [Dactylosporangium sp. CA-233914]|uniref:RICIN domain-containing protein n=1 Tax=Dactylosporangium sp. CA-233914 TaxID=3239934 RepID=UPI003D8E7B29